MHAPAASLAPIEALPLAIPGVRHAFFTRAGGVSGGIYESLNTGMGSDDLRESVLENRARAAGHIGASPGRLATPHQVHGTEAVIVEKAWGPGLGPKADAVVTDRPGIAVGVGTADCGPLLFADSKAGVVGAAHAGWKGALSGIVESTVRAMERLGAERGRIIAVIGPMISGDAYEVGPEFLSRFRKAEAENDRFFRPSGRADHHYFDLPKYLAERLRGIGVGEVHDLGLCTYADEERFFSYRRTVHHGEPDYGRLLSAIALE